MARPRKFMFPQNNSKAGLRLLGHRRNTAPRIPRCSSNAACAVIVRVSSWLGKFKMKSNPPTQTDHFWCSPWVGPQTKICLSLRRKDGGGVGNRTRVRSTRDSKVLAPQRAGASVEVLTPPSSLLELQVPIARKGAKNPKWFVDAPKEATMSLPAGPALMTHSSRPIFKYWTRRAKRLARVMEEKNADAFSPLLLGRIALSGLDLALALRISPSGPPYG